jgi:hypothetical protein
MLPSILEQHVVTTTLQHKNPNKTASENALEGYLRLVNQQITLTFQGIQ